ncbi:MAG: NINE protein [Saprospiraceae bacterium]|nr:NINE protein [Saprospiraceae bacterium]
MKKKFVAILLAVVAGGFGAHKFYLRQPELGVAYLALFIWLGRFAGMPLTAFLGWYDAYKLLTMDDAEFDRRYNSYFFRDRFGRRLEKSKEKTINRKGRYIMIDDDAPKSERNYPTVMNFKKRREAESFKQSGIKKFKEFDTKGAISDFKKALESNPDDFAIHFNIACAYSLEEQAMESFKHLDLAVANGFQQFERILNHEALAYIRVLPAFDAYKKNQYRLNEHIMTLLQTKTVQTKEEPLELVNKIPIELIKEK